MVMTDGAMDAIAAVALAWNRLSSAKTIIEQATAVEDMHNAMSDLSSWHPNYDVRTGFIQFEEEV